MKEYPKAYTFLFNAATDIHRDMALLLMDPIQTQSPEEDSRMLRARLGAIARRLTAAQARAEELAIREDEADPSAHSENAQ